MKLDRRSFFAALLAPLIARWLPKPKPKPCGGLFNPCSDIAAIWRNAKFEPYEFGSSGRVIGDTITIHKPEYVTKRLSDARDDLRRVLDTYAPELGKRA